MWVSLTKPPKPPNQLWPYCPSTNEVVTLRKLIEPSELEARQLLWGIQLS